MDSRTPELGVEVLKSRIEFRWLFLLLHEFRPGARHVHGKASGSYCKRQFQPLYYVFFAGKAIRCLVPSEIGQVIGKV